MYGNNIKEINHKPSLQRYFCPRWNKYVNFKEDKSININITKSLLKHKIGIDKSVTYYEEQFGECNPQKKFGEYSYFCTDTRYKPKRLTLIFGSNNYLIRVTIRDYKNEEPIDMLNEIGIAFDKAIKTGELDK